VYNWAGSNAQISTPCADSITDSTTDSITDSQQFNRYDLPYGSATWQTNRWTSRPPDIREQTPQCSSLLNHFLTTKLKWIIFRDWGVRGETAPGYQHRSSPVATRTVTKCLHALRTVATSGARLSVPRHANRACWRCVWLRLTGGTPRVALRDDDDVRARSYRSHAR
jgi:hypothetical protein